MSCNHCHKITHANFGETFECIYCEIDSSVAVPRANINIQLEDVSGILNASAIGEPAESILKCNAETLMKLSKEEKNTDQDRMVSVIEDEHVFYLKVTQLEANTAQYKYEIISVLDVLPPVGETSAELTGSPKKLLSVAEIDENTNTGDIQSPSAKRILFQPSTDTQ